MTRATVVGRDRELAVVDALVQRTGEGLSGALVIHGDAGVGKTALVDQALAGAVDGHRVERVVAAESEVELPYAGLHQLCRPMLPWLDRLPAPQADALDVALGVKLASAPPSPFLVGLALIGVLTEAARDQPLVCVVDDAQWLDAASRGAVAFAARRLAVESVALIAVMREVGDEFAGLETLRLDGLPDDVAETLLAEALPMPIDPRVRGQLIAEAAGNPLALRELPQALTPSELAGGYALTDAMPLSRRIEASLLARLEPLPASARTLLLLAAADPTGDTAVLWRARRILGLGEDASDAVERSGMLTLGVRPTFRHPLVRSAVHRAATAAERRAVHAALAEAIGARDPDQQAWHAAHAAATPDEPTAAAMERSASRARARGGEAAAAAFLERAAQLSPEPADRARRRLAAARSKLDAAAPAAASALLDALEPEHLAPADRAVLAVVRSRVTYGLRGNPEAALALVEAGRALLPHDEEHGRAAIAEGLYIALFSSAFEGRDGSPPPDPTETLYARVGREVLAALPGAGDSADPFVRLLHGQALRAVGARHASFAVLTEVADALRAADEPPPPAWTGLANVTAYDVWDPAALRAHVDQQVDGLRDRGELLALPNALSLAGVVRSLDGRLDLVDAIANEIDAIKDAARHPFPRYTHMLVAAWRGDADRFAHFAAEVCEGALGRGDASTISTANYAAATLANGLGRYADAVRVGLEELPYLREVTYSARIACELVEAAARTGETSIAERALTEVTWLTEPLVGSDWAQGTLAEARAQLAADTEAEALHHEAIERFDRAELPIHAGRARLTYGEWLRGQRRRADARQALRAAHAALTACGAHGFAARAARELAAAGEIAQSTGEQRAADLTAQEATVARLARDGLTNREIAARMFLSVRTVEYHLRKVFQKLGIASRRELAGVLDDQ